MFWNKVTIIFVICCFLTVYGDNGKLQSLDLLKRPFGTSPQSSPSDPTELTKEQMLQINCNSTQCEGLDDGTRIPSITTTQGYCECNIGTATFNICPSSGEFDVTTQECIAPVCDPEKCATADSFSFPATNTTNGFCVCIDSEVEYRDCLVGEKFNEAFGVCIAPVPNCEDSMCDGLPDHSALAAWTTQYGFCLCTGGSAEFLTCPTNYIFNSAMGACVVNVQLCEGIGASQTVAHPNDNTKFIVCLQNDAVELTCPNNECYDKIVPGCNLKACEISQESELYTKYCKQSNTWGQAVPGSQCDKYYICFDKTMDPVQGQCPANLHFSAKESKCVSPIEADCMPAEKWCINQMNGIKFAAEDCHQYYECLNQSSELKSCQFNEYFDKDQGLCLTGSCLSKGECRAEDHGLLLAHEKCYLYQLCYNKTLHEIECVPGYLFDIGQGRCVLDVTSGCKRD